MEKKHVRGKKMTTVKRPKIVVITGAESTGKSVLTQQLGSYFSSHYYPEYAREYLEHSGPGYGPEDIIRIARVQQSQMQEAVKLESDYVFFDTWLIITKVWMEVVYGKVPEWIPAAISGAPVDLFLLCENDIPWIPDPLRENGGEMRQKLLEIYRTNIHDSGFNYEMVSGVGPDRFNTAVRIILEKL